MRAILEDVRTGEVGIYDVPPPELRPGGVLIRTAFSAISAGTERAKVELGKKSLLSKAMARPDLVRQVIEYARGNGIRAAYEKVQAKLENLSPLGYSCSGVVVAVGQDVSEFHPGDRVACAGAGYANHAEVNFVPRNLVVRVPDNVGLEAAALSTIGAIAMQGVRQAQLTVGESVVIIGAGLVGVLAIQIARAAGCRVMALDQDVRRVQRAAELGAHFVSDIASPGLAAMATAFSRYGADAAILTAATPSSEPMTLAATLVRDRGRIVVVGNVGMDVPREHMYMKEISVFMSRSYGPGRYDPRYEEQGSDYPLGYVRWTERRNIEAFLDLLSSGAINVAPLLEHRYAADDAVKAYEAIRCSTAYTAILDYGSAAASEPREEVPPATRAVSREQLHIGCIGAGGFARSIMFPKLRDIKQVVLESVATASGIAAESARKSFHFASTATPAQLLTSPNIDAVFVLSRHDSHSAYAAAALASGKPVFVEKPLAVNREQLQSVRDAYSHAQANSGQPFLMVGFNRRFAPGTEKLRGFFAGRIEPMMVNIRVNAGYLPEDHWAHGDGGRIVGEFCHFVDWARFVVGAPVRSVAAVALPDGARYHEDNLAALFRFADGSAANIVYVANGDRAIVKEYFEVFCGGATAQLHDFRVLELARNGKKQFIKLDHDKGHEREIALTVERMRAGGSSPIAFDELIEVTEATLAVRQSLLSGAAFPISGSLTAVTAG